MLLVVENFKNGPTNWYATRPNILTLEAVVELLISPFSQWPHTFLVTGLSFVAQIVDNSTRLFILGCYGRKENRDHYHRCVSSFARLNIPLFLALPQFVEAPNDGSTGLIKAPISTKLPATPRKQTQDFVTVSPKHEFTALIQFSHKQKQE